MATLAGSIFVRSENARLPSRVANLRKNLTKNKLDIINDKK